MARLEGPSMPQIMGFQSVGRGLETPTPGEKNLRSDAHAPKAAIVTTSAAGPVDKFPKPMRSGACNKKLIRKAHRFHPVRCSGDGWASG